MEEEFGVEITKEKLKESIKLRNKERLTLKDFYELGKMCSPPITGLEMLKVLNGASFKCDKDEEIKGLRDLVDRSKREYEEGRRKV